MAADNTTSTHPDGCKQSQLSGPEVAHDAIEVVIVDHDAIVVTIHNDCVGEERPAAEPLETIHNNIYRFPSNLRRVSTERDYIEPRTIALGPYFHGVPELQAMEVIKHRAVDYFFERLGKPREEIYKEFIPVARKARCCYVDASALAGITDDKFFSIMLVDGIFLVQFLGDWLGSMVNPYSVGIVRDMMLLENQIPWLVVQFFMDLSRLSLEQIVSCLMIHSTGIVIEEPLVIDLGESYRPSHLLCLLRTYRAGRSGRGRADPRRLSRKITTSAAELTQMGIKLRAGKTTTAKFSDMDLVRGYFFADLSLLPLYLYGNTACWLVNMAALEMYTESLTMGDDCAINSYLAILSTLMTREQDVRELRTNRVLDGFSDQHTLDFIQGLSPYLTPGHAYLRTVLDIQEYMLDRRLWIAIYRFLYNNGKIIATVLPIVSVLVGILKALLFLKQD